MKERFIDDELLVLELPEEHTELQFLRPYVLPEVKVGGFIANKGESQDAAAYSIGSDGTVIAAVADGIPPKGAMSDKAARYAVTEFVQRASIHSDQLAEFIESLDEDISRTLTKSPRTTFTGAIIEPQADGSKLAKIISIGDSSAYKITSNGIISITSESDEIIVNNFLGGVNRISGQKDSQLHVERLTSSDESIVLMTDGIEDMMKVFYLKSLYPHDPDLKKMFGKSPEAIVEAINSGAYKDLVPNFKTDAALVSVTHRS